MNDGPTKDWPSTLSVCSGPPGPSEPITSMTTCIGEYEKTQIWPVASIRTKATLVPSLPRMALTVEVIGRACPHGYSVRKPGASASVDTTSSATVEPIGSRPPAPGSNRTVEPAASLPATPPSPMRVSRTRVPTTGCINVPEPGWPPNQPSKSTTTSTVLYAHTQIVPPSPRPMIVCPARCSRAR